jgi:hypothetical protein
MHMILNAFHTSSGIFLTVATIMKYCNTWLHDCHAVRMLILLMIVFLGICWPLYYTAFVRVRVCNYSSKYV